MKASDVSKLFTDEYGRELILTKGQQDIFSTIIKRKYPRVNVICPTQFGKSLTTALGIVIRFLLYPEKWAIIAPQEKKARIIMNHLIDHIFDDPYFYSKLEIDEPLERLRRERSKNRLTSKVGGEVFIATGDARNRQRVKESLMGFGCIQAGEKVWTDEGEINIEKLVKNKKTNKVYSYNHKTDKIELTPILEYQKNPLGNRELLELDLGDRKIVCTDDHPVWVVGKGYIPAKKIRKTDKVWVSG